MTLLYLDERFLLHETGQHPESPERLRRIHEALKSSDVGLNHDRVKLAQPVAASDDDLLRVHTREYLNEVVSFAASGGGRIESDTVVCPKSADIARLAAGCVVDAVERIVRSAEDTSEHRQALCLVRPPGHHALPDGAMGFCLFSNAAIAARTAIQRFDLNRVLIVDWDVHHGNGTQDAFYEDEQVTFFSAHRFPFYPGTGRKSETGRRAGLGSTFNLPLAFGIGRKEYLSAFEQMLTKAADSCRPDLVIISAGFDAHAADPVGSLGLETGDFQQLTQLVLNVADSHCDGRIVSVLEGGYNVDRLADCVTLHLQTMAKWGV